VSRFAPTVPIHVDGRFKECKVTFEYPTFQVAGTDILPPDETRSADIFSRLGYKFWDAVADLVDNSVDAGASHVLVRFVRSDSNVERVIIADNGSGMDDDELREAMRFGSRSKKNQRQLGKYGIGLKSASLSQAEVVTVLSKRKSKLVGRRWKIENIKRGWECERLAAPGLRAIFATDFGELVIRQSGTIIVWERLEHLRALPQNLDKVLEKTIKQLRIELGIRFHRFIDDNRLTLLVDQQFPGDPEPEIQQTITSLHPFSYGQSPRSGYPAKLPLIIDDTRLIVRCHIWPSKSTAPGYRLGGGKIALRQGFYFYRNDRVIQAGGWNGLRADDGEPHLSLARVEISLPATLDSMFKLDVTKSTLDPSPRFLEALLTARSGEITFPKYLETADAVYRQQKKKDGARFPFVPGSGLPTRAIRAIAGILREKGTGPVSKVGFRWKRLDHDEMFRVDSAANTVLLNTIFRSDLTEGNSNDAPVLKVALMFLVQDHLEKARRTKSASDWLQRVNFALIAALKGK
jgi:hypothetical protein